MRYTNDKWIDDKFEIQSDMSGIALQEISLHLQNMIGCLEFLIGYLGFWYNQTHKHSYIFNENEHEVYNEIYISD